MFSALYDTILPFIGEFFGKITAFASVSVNDFLEILKSKFTTFNYTNLFNGDVGSYYIYIADAIQIVLSPVRWLTVGIFSFAGIPLTTPLWAALLLAVINVAIVLGFVKFIISIV